MSSGASTPRLFSIRTTLLLFLTLMTPVSAPYSHAAPPAITPILTLEGSSLNTLDGGANWYTTAGPPESVTVNSGRGGLTKTFTPAAGALFGGRANGDSLTGTIGSTSSIDTVTVEMWLKLSDSGTVENAAGSMIFSWNQGLNVDNYNIYHYAGKLGFNTFNADLYGFASSSLENNQWNHFAFVMSKTGVESDQKIYVNGVARELSCLVGVCTNPRNFASDGRFLFMDNAKAVGTWNAKGTIGQIKIYSQNITAAKALSNFESSRSSYITGLGTSTDVTISKSASPSDSFTVLNAQIPTSDSMTISGFDTQTIRATVSTDTGTVNITSSSGLSKATGSGYANSGANAITERGSTIAFEGSTSDVQAALDTLKLNLPTSRTSSFSGSATVTISVSFVGGVTTAYNANNGSFYRNFGSLVTWQAAMDLTTASSNCGITFNGLCGYLATVTSETETAFIADKVTTAQSWIGGNDRAVEGTWRWPDNSPEAGAIFFKDSANNSGTVNINFCLDGLQGYCPAAVTGNISRYNNWNDGEPNEFGSSEDAMQILSGGSGRWNDLPANSSTLPYIIEFGGKPGEAVTYQPRTRNIIVNFSYTYPTDETTVVSTTICQSISIASLTPLGGSSSGGTRLTINGQGLTSSVYINGRAADVRLSSSTSVIVLTPPGLKGSATLRVDGCNASATSTYLYDPDPVISSLNSSFISTTGGVITITGTFLSGASITIGTARAIISSNTDALITATLPASSAGEKTMTLTTDFGSTASKLIYLDPPSLKTTLSVPYIAQGDTVSISFAATGATSYRSSAGLPSGLNLNPSTGLLTGTAIKEGIYSFSIIATNAVGSDTKSYNLDIDRPTPKAISTNIYFAPKNSSLSASNKTSLNRLIAKVKAVSPRNLSATITMTGGAGTTMNSLAPTRHNQIKGYLESQGIQIRTNKSNIGSANKIGISITWERN